MAEKSNKIGKLTGSGRTALSLIGTAILTGGCATGSSDRPEQAPAMELSTFTSAPLRNSVKVLLDAPHKEVWALVSDHTQLPTYSAGLKAVIVDNDTGGPGGGVGCMRTCIFFEGPNAVEEVVYVQEYRVLATCSIEPNEYQTTNELSVVTLKPLSENRTEYEWQLYYDHPAVDEMKSAYDLALQDIGQRLAQRFGGRIVP